MEGGADGGSRGARRVQRHEEKLNDDGNVLQFDSAASQAVRSWIETMQKEWEKTLKAQLFVRFSKDATVLFRLARCHLVTADCAAHAA